jgi:hypothetical protein
MAESTSKTYNFDKVPSVDFGEAASFEPIVGNIFEGRAPSFNMPFSDIASNFEPYAAQYGYSDSSRDSEPSWLGKGIEAVNKALAYKNQTTMGSSGGSRSSRGYSSNAPAVSQGRGYTMYLPGPTEKTTQSGGSRGIGGAIGTLAGIGVSLIPGVGPAAAAAAPALGGTLGGFFG